MIPIGDDNSDRRTTPFVTWLLIAVNIFVFLAVQGMGTNERATLALATVPYEILTGRDVAQRVGTALREHHRRLLSGLTPEEREGLALGLTGLLRVLDELTTDTP